MKACRRQSYLHMFKVASWERELAALHIWLYSGRHNYQPKKVGLGPVKRKNLVMISVGQHRKAISRISSRWPLVRTFFHGTKPVPSWPPAEGLYLWALSPPFPLSSFPRCSWGSEEEGEALDSWNEDDAMDRTEQKQLRLSPESVRRGDAHLPASLCLVMP